jgi:hypothetical protein
MREPHEPRPVVYKDCLFAVQRLIQNPLHLLVGLLRGAIGGGVNGHAAFGQGCGDIVLHEEGAGAGHGHVSPDLGQHHR